MTRPSSIRLRCRRRWWCDDALFVRGQLLWADPVAALQLIRDGRAKVVDKADREMLAGLSVSLAVYGGASPKR